MKNLFIYLSLLLLLTSCGHIVKVKLDSNKQIVLADSEFDLKENEKVIVAFTLDENNNPYPGIRPAIITSIPVNADTALSYSENGKGIKYLLMRGIVVARK